MRLEKGDKPGSWFARFPRNDKLCCNYEQHLLLDNLGNVDWRPCMNLWAVCEYITKYATKAPKGTKRMGDVLAAAVDEVCKFELESEGVDMLRKTLQKVFSKTVGDRDYGIFEAVHLGLRLPLIFFAGGRLVSEHHGRASASLPDLAARRGRQRARDLGQ